MLSSGKRTFTKAAILTLSMALPALPTFAAETYYSDQGHTEVRFEWSHAGVSVQAGEFTVANATLTLDPDDIAKSSVAVTIPTNSVSTGFVPLDTHLKSADFLEVETYPEITFQSTSVAQTGDDTADITGDLTIHGVTKSVTLKAALTHKGEHPLGKFLDYYKGQWIAFTASTVIDHQEFKVGSFSTGPITIAITTELKDRE